MTPSAPRVILRPMVPDDLRSILDYLAADSPATADRFAESAETTLASLAAMPGKGSRKHFRSARLTGTQSWPIDGFPNHLILYRPIDVGIEVLAITHGARDLPKLLRGRA